MVPNEALIIVDLVSEFRFLVELLLLLFFYFCGLLVSTEACVDLQQLELLSASEQMFRDAVGAQTTILLVNVTSLLQQLLVLTDKRLNDSRICFGMRRDYRQDEAAASSCSSSRPFDSA